MNNIYKIVKEAIDNKYMLLLSSTKYYLSDEISENFSSALYKKAVAVKTFNNENKMIYKINSFDDYLEIIKKGAVSIYEPVDVRINSFRVKIANDKLSKNEIISSLITIRNKFRDVGFSAEIVKTENDYAVKCISKNDYNTDKIYSFAAEITKGLNADLSELKMGKLKRNYYSLDDNGHEDIIINIGEI